VELGEYNVQEDFALRKCPVDIFSKGPGSRAGFPNCKPYTPEGWLKGINMPMAGDPGGDGTGGFRTGTDAFAFALGYYEGDFKPINPNAVVSDTRDQLWDRYRDIRDTTAAQGLYNGNISWMSTDLPGLSGSNRMQAIVNGYDQLHRIAQARSLTEYGATGYAERTAGTKAYDVDYTYDPNGNLLSLQRLDENTSLRDDLTYEYYSNTNRLRNTNPADGENYTYDEIGNLVSDNEEGIDSIVWTPYGKVRAVVKDDNSEVRFRYDASGNRISKIAGYNCLCKGCQWQCDGGI
jgi:YD repeat-containing protein